MRILLMLLLSLLNAPILIAKDHSGNYAAAEDAYRQGDFAGAIRIYLAAIQDGEEGNASVYYNLGTSLYKNGETGAALAAHLRARSLDPSDPDIRYNLRLLQEKARDKLDTKFAQDRWQERSAAALLSERALFWWTVIPWTLVLSLIGGSLLAGRSSWLTWTPALILVIGSLYPGLSLAYTHFRAPDWGAVVAEEVEVYASPTIKNAVAIFQLHEGAPCAVINESGDWYKIQLSDGKTGWIQREHVAIFGKNFFSYQTAKNGGSPEKPAL